VIIGVRHYKFLFFRTSPTKNLSGLTDILESLDSTLDKIHSCFFGTKDHCLKYKKLFYDKVAGGAEVGGNLASNAAT
jgi:hypothetical protein